MAKPIASKVAVVTGAANGIGRAIALRFARDGADVALIDIDAAGLETLAAETRALGSKTVTVTADCTDKAAVEAAFASIRAQRGEVDILVNNVGHSARARMTDFSEATLETLDFIVNLNLKSCMYCARQVTDGMRARRSGKIINITSESAVNGSARTWEYSAAKAGVIGFTRSIARELAPFNINVNAIGPGFTRTPGIMDTIAQDLKEKIISQIPMGRIGEPDEIANCVAFFASSQSDYITGQTLLVNGGNWML